MGLARYLKLKKLTLRAFAKKADLSVSVISKVARGLVKPEIDTAKKIRRASEGRVDFLR